MMAEELQAAEANQEVTQAAPEAAVSSQEPARDYAVEAREMGWVPEADFKGPKDKWKPAQQFVEDGEKILPIVRSQNRKLQERIDKQEAEFAKRLERMERMSNTTVERLKAQHKADLDRVEAGKLAAVEAGDTAEYKRLDREGKELAKVTIEETKADPNVEYQAKVDKFVEANPWYASDDVMQAYADRISQKLARDNPSITFEENARQTVAQIKAKFPEKFTAKPVSNGHASVDGGGDFAGAPQRKGPADKLPAEARAQAEKDVKAGLYKNVDDWAKVYLG